MGTVLRVVDHACERFEVAEGVPLLAGHVLAACGGRQAQAMENDG